MPSSIGRPGGDGGLPVGEGDGGPLLLSLSFFAKISIIPKRKAVNG